jgi:glycosyltransferase involved in cell wall biosynthesis
MIELSVIIPARQEEWLSRTVAGVLESCSSSTEVVVILDGAPANPPLTPHPRLTVIQHSQSIGQRAAINEGVALSRAKYICKLDAHCILDKDFDQKMIAQYEPDWTVVPRLFNLHAFDWICSNCQHRTYQGGKPDHCNQCGSPDVRREVVWQPKRTKTDSMCFDHNLEFQYWGSFGNRPDAQGDISDTMSLLGACFFMERAQYWRLGGSDEKYGSWGQQGTEIACKSWLSGGRLVCNKTTWYSHLFRTQPGFGFPYPGGGDKRRAMARCQEMWLDNKWSGQVRPLAWLIEHFAPTARWHGGPTVKVPKDATPEVRQEIEAAATVQMQRTLERVMEAGDKFYRERGLTVPPRKSLGPPADLTKGVVYCCTERDRDHLTDLRKHLNGHALVTVSPTKLTFHDDGLVFSGGKTDSALAGIAELNNRDVLYVVRGNQTANLDWTPPRSDTVYKSKSGVLCGYSRVMIDHHRGHAVRIDRRSYK